MYGAEQWKVGIAGLWRNCGVDHLLIYFLVKSRRGIPLLTTWPFLFISAGGEQGGSPTDNVGVNYGQ